MKSLTATAILALGVLAVQPAHAGDCVPLAFRELAAGIGRGVSYDVWAKELMPDGKTSPSVAAALDSWKKHFPDRPLLCVYSVVKGVPYEDRAIDYGATRYLWVGKIPAKMAADPNSDDAHAAVLVIVSKDRFKLINAIDAEGKQFFIEILNEKEFFERTYLVYQVLDKTSP